MAAVVFVMPIIASGIFMALLLVAVLTHRSTRLSDWLAAAVLTAGLAAFLDEVLPTGGNDIASVCHADLHLALNPPTMMVLSSQHAQASRRTAIMKISKLSRGLGVAMLTGLLAATALVAPVAAEQEEKASSKKTIYKIAKSNDDFDTLTKAVKAAGLKKALTGKDMLTVFAPTDDAFEQVDASVLEGLLADKDALAELLTYHVAEGKVLSSDLEDGQIVESLSGEEFTISLSDDGATIVDGAGNTTNITATDIKAKNGIIHVIDAVLMPAS